MAKVIPNGRRMLWCEHYQTDLNLLTNQHSKGGRILLLSRSNGKRQRTKVGKYKALNWAMFSSKFYFRRPPDFCLQSGNRPTERSRGRDLSGARDWLPCGQSLTGTVLPATGHWNWTWRREWCEWALCHHYWARLPREVSHSEDRGETKVQFRPFELE